MTDAWTPPADTWGTPPPADTWGTLPAGEAWAGPPAGEAWAGPPAGDAWAGPPVEETWGGSPPGDAWGGPPADEMADLAARNRAIEEARDAGAGRTTGPSTMDNAVARQMRERLGQLRASFDRSFADPPREQVVQFHDLLAITVAGRRYALRLAQSAGLFPNRRVTPLPGPIAALLGVAGFRGSIVPVYSLAAVLGQPPQPESRWLVLASGEPAVALAFEALDGHLRIPAAEVIEEQIGHGPRGCLRGIVQRPEGARPIVDVAAVRAAIQALTHG
ncbi:MULTISPECIES: chemotaxis protein CheW [Catenuloplanes]|uniref:Purine-binding chemotaxis protein CheW n=1 Tax=Catenuloplanes niger TaxID=587534 RepID=A0AAE4CNT5_9ACTN|nr:chemotaxis protein CheW [Catenuloplanes niger]MDR7319826.1 purine-binding chemotaxis protein CheW [Catenuloplanes niger]